MNYHSRVRNYPFYCPFHTSSVLTREVSLRKQVMIMELYKQTDDITLIGIEVKTFPQGVKEAFDSLIETLGADRPYYGVSWMDERNNIIYFAMAREAFPGEGQPHAYESLVMQKGEYKTEAVHNWLSKTDSIKDIFHGLMGNSTPDKNLPCIEWYKSDDEMLCMIRAV